MNGRLYDPVIGRFFSPDLFVQQPEFTQDFNRYTYARNNPLKYKDPTGWWYEDDYDMGPFLLNTVEVTASSPTPSPTPIDDIWDFDEDGNFIRRTRTTEYDQVRIWDRDRKNIITQTELLPYKTITNHNRPIASINGIPTTLDILRILGNVNAKLIFEMFAKFTNVEWTWSQIGQKGSEKNMVGTSHSSQGTAVGDYLFREKYNINVDIHNHPSGFPVPSLPPGDLQVVQPWIDKFPNIELYIYINDGSRWGFEKGYYSYDLFYPAWRIGIKP